MSEGFLVGKWNDPNVYAAVPYGQQYIILHKGQQIKLCRTEQSARNFIAKDKKGKSVGELPL